MILDCRIFLRSEFRSECGGRLSMFPFLARRHLHEEEIQALQLHR